MLDRKTLIKKLTQYELKWFLDQEDQSLLDEITGFFANGGYTNWSDENLMKKYNLFIKEEIENA